MDIPAPFLDNSIQITKQDRHNIEMAKKKGVKVYEYYENTNNGPKIQFKSFGLNLKNTNESVFKLSKKFRAIRFKSEVELPKNFDGPQIWKKYLTPITDQGKCGNCWAHASSAVLADRFAIMSLG